MSYCPICQNDYSVYFLKKQGHYDIFYCLDCKVQFSHPMEEIAGIFYTQSSLYEDRSKGNLVLFPSKDWRFKSCFRFCDLKRYQRLLDVGCGDGSFMALARDKGLDAFGIDIDEAAVYLARERRGLRQVKNIGWRQLKDIDGWNNFDMITSFDVLEHVSSPLSFMNMLFGLLKPGGWICISAPRLDRYPAFFDSEVDAPPHHFTLWTSTSLEVLLKKTGFEYIRIIKKPLLIEDIALHIFLQVKRLVKKINADKDGICAQQRLNSQTALTYKRSYVFMLILWLKKILKCMDRGFIMFNLGKGYTLLAIAHKPCRGISIDVT